MLPPGGHRIEYRLEKDVHQVYRGIQRMLSAYKDEKRGPTYIAVQSPHGMNISLPILANFSPALKIALLWKKRGGGLYRIWVVCHSVRPFVRPFVRHIFSELFYRIYSNFVCALILTWSSFGLLHIIFPKFVPELWHFIYAKISFPLNILRTTRHIFTKFYIFMDIDKI